MIPAALPPVTSQRDAPTSANKDTAKSEQPLTWQAIWFISVFDIGNRQ
jgi:hypothetical protein